MTGKARFGYNQSDMQIQELGHVVFYVSNLERSANFYRDTLGFPEIFRSSQAAIFSSGRTHHELLLLEVGGTPSLDHEPKPGLYHIGFKIGDGPEAAKETYRELVEHGVTIVGTGDHGVTHSIYILDPDGNELELYADVSDNWKTNPKALMQGVKALNLN
jgi:catechol-2,3-dioxygenase